MAHSLSAQKRVRQNLKARLRNRRLMTNLRAQVKAFLKLIQTAKYDEAKTQLPKLYKCLDQVAAKGTLHSNTASRYKSRLTKRLTKAQTSKAAA